MSPAQTVADVKAAVEALQGESRGWVLLLCSTSLIIFL